MSTENRNSRTICFRIDAEEYEQVRQLCLEQGTGNLSEMARAGLKLILSQPNLARSESLASRVADLESKLRSLYLEMKRLHPSPASPQLSSAAEQ